ncbi:ExbD/TolR family protein [Thermocoleostomius sinensis]|uniref:Biopolymer transporter ExbD n=1 Tax=Thermocoleostomius sinensis A174 TaxID=2016057 RepID=A0A9E8ZGE0_9CYAN|nr:biopolymer transporter ExbD [Thermocoleostomius sinensis]WAL58046.1 biopolymer transporter ExbD [Thermocoleostomius sinensis A174]
MRIIDNEPDVPAQINIVPMIDVIFAILTFFIMATLFLTRSEGLPVNLPKAQTAQSQQQTRITVTIDDEGQVSLNRQPIEVSQLANQVKVLMENESSALVIINADTKVEHGQVIAVMDQLRTVEGATLGIATQRP